MYCMLFMLITFMFEKLNISNRNAYFELAAVHLDESDWLFTVVLADI